MYAGPTAYARDEALEWYRRVDAAARRPYIYLSAGVSAPQFREQLGLASESGARYSGVLCGRATWQDGVPVSMPASARRPEICCGNDREPTSGLCRQR